MRKKKKPELSTLRDRRYRAGRRAAGLTRVHVFVPEDDAPHIRNLAKLLRDCHDAGEGFAPNDITESIAKALRDEI